MVRLCTAGADAGLTPEDAGDVSQEVFATLSTKLDSFQRERPGDSFRRWLKTVTNNRARDLHRRHKDRPRARGGTAAQLEMAAQPDGDHFELLDESDAERAEESNQLFAQRDGIGASRLRAEHLGCVLADRG